jgi:shikimate dehydrogenase
VSELEERGYSGKPVEIPAGVRPKALWPSPRTLVAGVVGFPVRHSLSPRLQNAAYAAMGLDWCYLAFEVPPGSLERAVSGAAALGLRGLSVTMPHKDAAARLATRHSRQVRRLGAANTLIFEADAVRAESCDGDGLLDDLREGAGFDPDGRRCGVIGAGGAGRAAVLALAEAGAAEIVVVNRTATRAWKSVALAPRVAHVGRPEELKGMDLVVQATPMGMPGTEASRVSSPRLMAGSTGSKTGTQMGQPIGAGQQGSSSQLSSDSAPTGPEHVAERGVLGVFGFRRPVEAAAQPAPGVAGRETGPKGVARPAQPVGVRAGAYSPAGWANGVTTSEDALVAGVDPSWFGAGQLVVDLVYDPVRTPFLMEAERHGAAVRSGLGMLVHQAARQIIFWTGAAPPLEVMWNVVEHRFA